MPSPALLVAALLAAWLVVAVPVALVLGRVLRRRVTASAAPAPVAPVALPVVVIPAQRSASPTRHRARHRSDARRPHTHPSWDLAPAGARREPAPRYLLGTVDDTGLMPVITAASFDSSSGGSVA